MSRTVKDPVKAVDISGLSSYQLSELSRRCLATRKALNARGKAARVTARKAKLAARKAKLEKELANIG